MELVIILVLIGVVIFLCKDYKFVIYLIGTLELFFRLIHYIGDNVSFIRINSFVNKYIPSSLFNVIDKYTSGVVQEIFNWVLVFIFIFWLIYLVRYIINRK